MHGPVGTEAEPLLPPRAADDGLGAADLLFEPSPPEQVRPPLMCLWVLVQYNPMSHTIVRCCASNDARVERASVVQPARSNGAGGQLRALGVEDAGGACGAWLSAVAVDARLAVGRLLRSCATPEQLDAALRAAIGAWRRGAAVASDVPKGEFDLLRVLTC